MIEPRYSNKLKPISSFYNGLTIFFEKIDLLKVFLAPGSFDARWCITWQLCCENNLSDLGYINSAISVKICVNLS